MRRPLVLGWFLVAVVLLKPLVVQADTALSFSQVDYYQNGSLTDQDSPWGEFNIGYDTGASLEWINVVANPGSGSESWIVQNHPLLPSTLAGGSTFSSLNYFDLGVSGGTDVTSIDIRFLVSPLPLSAAPSVGTLATVDVGTSQNIINNGVPSGIAALNTPGGALIDWSSPFVGAKTGDRPDMPNVVQERNFCGPGAAANSLQWLNAQHGFGLQQTLSETQTELAGNMGNANDGNWDNTEVQGKLQYALEHNLPIEIHYTGGVMLPTAGNFVEPNGNGTARNDGPISWDWLQSEFEKGQDIELMTDTHWVVMDGFINWDDVHLFSYRDDPFQKGAATTAAQQAIIDNRHVWTYFSNGSVNIGNGNETLRAAIAESPVPEPSSLFLLGTGLLGFAGWRRRWKSCTTP